MSVHIKVIVTLVCDTPDCPRDIDFIFGEEVSLPQRTAEDRALAHHYWSNVWGKMLCPQCTNERAEKLFYGQEEEPRRGRKGE